MRLVFGRDGNASDYVEGGWSVPEDGFTWTTGTKASISIPNPGPSACRLTLRYSVFVPPGSAFQRARLSVGGQHVAAWVATKGTDADFWIGQDILAKAGDPLQIDIDLPDARAPAEFFPDHADKRMLGLMFRTIEIEPILDARSTALADIAASMESLGSNCEFGLVQRHLGVEPLGLLRFSTSRLASLLPALDSRFEGIGLDLDFVVHGNEWMTLERRYGFVAHTRQNQNQVTREQIARVEARRLPRLAEKLIADLEAGEKMFVYQGDRATTPENGLPLLAAIRRYNPRNTLLLVVEDPARSGQVECHTDGMMVGYMPKLTETVAAVNLQVEPWIDIVRRTHALRNETSDVAI